ncbi:uncharacterized protein LOC125072190 [Vanessa atalanta]|uniref:uncharacterized protein LOC125072190 n=1 Tax=Vanessa atalanta TaxID=42275 RepID=UPI001FCD45F6|nr:uncharacterized protein LOC125072190 [Vanessa atalanta]
MGPKKGEVIARQKDNVTVMKWRDKRDVALISTCHGADMRMSSGYRPMMKPEAVLYYNERKKGIDVSDQLAIYYDPKRKSLAWYKKIALDVLICASSNVSMASKRRKVVHSEGRSMIASVYHFLREEYEFTKSVAEPNCDLSHLGDITRRTAEATGDSMKTVQRILKEEKELPSCSSNFTSPMKKRRKRDSKVEIDNFTADVVRSTIQNFHVIHKEIPTLAKLKTVLNEKIGFDGCIETVRQLLLKLGYKWRKTENNRKVLTERDFEFIINLGNDSDESESEIEFDSD